MQEFQRNEIEAVDVTGEEMENYYEEHKTEYEEATAKHILISSAEGDSQEDKDNAKAKADDILVRIRKGEDFAELAKEYSEDPGSKDNGGEYTFRRNGQMVKEFEDWTFSNNAGDTGLVKTYFGYHVMKLESKRLIDFEEASDEIKNMIKIRKYDEMLKGWVNEEKYAVKKNQSVYDSIN
jgi:foldase protein PrsA